MYGWIEFAAALTAFLLSHMLPARPVLRARLVSVMGERAYLASYSILSLGLLYWLILAAGRAPYVELWSLAPWQYWVPNLVMPAVILLICLSVGAPNPLSFGGARNDAFDPGNPGIAGLVRHPLLWALLLWSLAHIAPNGDVAHVVLFVLFAGLSAGGMRLIDLRKRRKLGHDVWHGMARNTSNYPARALITTGRMPRLSGLWPRLLAACIVYVGLFAAHQWLIGVSPSPLF